MSSRTIADLKTRLIKAGVKNLKDFGYPHVDETNILTDEVYSEFFLGMLNDNKGNGADIDTAIDELIKQIKPE